MLKSKTKKFLLGILLCIFAAFFALPSIAVSQKAYGYFNLPTGDYAIGNIFDETQGKFLGKNLDALAERAGFDNLENMIDYINDGGEPKTAVDFQHSTVKFGKSFGGDGVGAEELVWIPAYLSNSTQGPILTLWLATAIYEKFSFNTQYNANASTKPSSNNYSTSKLRAETLNNTGVYYSDYGNNSTDKTSSLTAVNYTATNANTHRFQMYTTGALASYIVAPADVSWQTGEGSNRLKNDPGWTGDTSGYYFQDKDGNSQTWVNDKLWLPSLYEVYNNSLSENTAYWSYNSYGGGLWGTNYNERVYPENYWTRTGQYDSVYRTFLILSNQDGVNDTYVNSNPSSVRPALHLNLTKVKNNSVVHVHEWQTSAETDTDGWKVTKEATCTEEGAKQRVCTADDCTLTDNKEVETIEINPTAHTPGTAATCTEPQICEECEEELVPAKGHNYATAWTTDDDNHWHICNNGCGIKDSDGEHSGGTATCQQKATCEVCGQTYGSLGDHDLEHHAAKAPTCTEIGWNAYDTCKLCDYTTYVEIAANGHTPSDWITDDEPTCTEAGSKHKECMVCHTTLETGTIPETGHDYSSEWETDGSNHWHICANECGIKGSNAPHTFKWEIDKAASFTETGLRHEECTVCHLKRNENTVIPLVTCLHENTTHHDKVPATCVEKGTVEYKYCSDCQKNLDMSDVELSDLEIPIDPNNHAWGEWEVTKQPNCTEKGTEKRTCADCNHEETRDIAIAPEAHDFEHHETKEPTCTEIGWNEYDTCKRDGCNYTTYVEIVAKGHDFSITVDGTPPTCQEGGTATMKCSRCEETKVQDSADPVDHVYTNYVSNGNATCTANGTKTAECDFGCGATDTIDDEGSATGHTPGEEATCTTAQTCEVCGAELAPALGHDWASEWSKDETNHWHICSRCDELNENTTHTYEWVITKEATVEEPGLMENLCTVCGDKDGEEEIAKLIDPNGEIDLPVDINVEFKVTQSSTGNNYSEIDKSLKLGYWAQLWYRNDDGTLGDEFTDTINCFLTLKIPTDIIEAIRGGEEINRDKIAAGLKVYYIDGEGTPVEVNNFTIAMRDDDSWQIKFNYNEKFRAEVVFAADLDEPVPEEPASGIPWWVWLLVILGSATLLAIIIVIIVVAKKKKGDNTPTDNGEVLQRLDNQDQVLNELLNRGDDGGFNTPVELDENGNVIFK